MVSSSLCSLRRLHLSPKASTSKLSKPVIATLGSFDGIHTGHARIFFQMEALRSELSGDGRKGTKILISFYPHPAEVLGARKEHTAVTGLRERLRIFAQHGIDQAYLVHFSKDFSLLPAESFLQRFLIDTLDIDRLVIGVDAAVGHKRQGDVNFISAFLKEQGRQVHILDFETIDGTKIGSSQLRDFIQSGEVHRVLELSTHPYCFQGRVRRGDGRGKKLGIPTANLARASGYFTQVVPPRGVYATRALCADKVYQSVTNIGVRPTFGGSGETVIETHFLDYGGGDIYDAHVELEFHRRIREEKKFSGIDSLLAQIRQDIEDARFIFAKGAPL